MVSFRMQGMSKIVRVDWVVSMEAVADRRGECKGGHNLVSALILIIAGPLRSLVLVKEAGGEGEEAAVGLTNLPATWQHEPAWSVELLPTGSVWLSRALGHMLYMLAAGLGWARLDFWRAFALIKLRTAELGILAICWPGPGLVISAD